MQSFGRNIVDGTPAGKIGDESGKEVFRVGDSSVVVPGKPTEEPQTTPEKANQEKKTNKEKRFTKVANGIKNFFGEDPGYKHDNVNAEEDDMEGSPLRQYPDDASNDDSKNESFFKRKN